MTTSDLCACGHVALIHTALVGACHAASGCQCLSVELELPCSCDAADSEHPSWHLAHCSSRSPR